MDLIKDIKDKEQADLAERLSSYDETIMIVSHDGDLMEVPEFEIVRATTLKELLSIPTGTLVAIGSDHVDLADCVAQFSESMGVNIAVLIDVPNQVTSPDVSAKLGLFRPISFMRVLNDIADQRLVEANMTQMEIQNSQAKKSDSMLRNKQGNIRPLIDFDRSFGPEQVEEVEASDDE